VEGRKVEKQDIMYGVLALGIILIVALVIKPMATGQAIDIGLPTQTPVETPDPAVPLTPYIPRTTVATPTNVPTTPAPTPTPRATWDPGMSSIGFVDPAQYGISLDQTIPGGTRFDNVPLNTSLTTLATISGRYSGTSQTIYMPYPYWELWYTVEPSGPIAGKDAKESTSTTSKSLLSVSKESKSTGTGSDSTGTPLEGSYSVIFPQFIIQVMDANDPNRIVRTITPPGGIDKDLWAENLDVDVNVDATNENSKTDSISISLDPRPWKEKFFEGERNYFFIINAQSLDSYTIEFRVPTRYLGNTTASTL
jgi:hypothetical protein